MTQRRKLRGRATLAPMSFRAGAFHFRCPPPAFHARPPLPLQPPTPPLRSYGANPDRIIGPGGPPRKVAVAATGPSAPPRPLPLEPGTRLGQCDALVNRPFQSRESRCKQGWPGSRRQRGFHQRPFAAGGSGGCGGPRGESAFSPLGPPRRARAPQVGMHRFRGRHLAASEESLMRPGGGTSDDNLDGGQEAATQPGDWAKKWSLARRWKSPG